MKKFLIIPILIVAYIYFFVPFISTISFQPIQTKQTISPSGGAEVIGIGESVSVTVTRPYLFGLIRLPIYTNQFGYIGLYHEIFFYFIIILTVTFIIQEIKYKKRGAKMVKKANWTRYVMPIVWGIVFALIAYLLSGDNSSIVVGLLVMYLEYKLRK